MGGGGYSSSWSHTVSKRKSSQRSYDYNNSNHNNRGIYIGYRGTDSTNEGNEENNRDKKFIIEQKELKKKIEELNIKIQDLQTEKMADRTQLESEIERLSKQIQEVETERKNSQDLERLIEDYIHNKYNQGIMLLKKQYDAQIINFFNIIDNLIKKIGEIDNIQAQKLNEKFTEIKNKYMKIRRETLNDINIRYTESNYSPKLELKDEIYDAELQLSRFVDWMDEVLKYYGLYRVEFEPQVIVKKDEEEHKKVTFLDKIKQILCILFGINKNNQNTENEREQDLNEFRERISASQKFISCSSNTIEKDVIKSEEYGRNGRDK